ncbi:NAD(P)H-binding protein [Sphingobacterium sp. 40-24]|uniref:NAD(P)H-binding protein n=1 Tax=Sphingobacterium sp. 40-24 TaxID=1895843 RepID=UPI000AF9A274|nr:NAD(P)H-binding protein [Sphingobacterium sp. 40-24]
MKVVLIGSSGATGRALIQLMLKSKEVTEIVVLLRRVSFDEHIKLKQVIVDFENLTDFEREIQGDIAISCLGTTLKDAGSKDAQWKIDHDLNLQFAALAKKNGFPTFLLLSALLADPASKIFYNRMKGTLEQDVKALNFNRLIIFQPRGLIRPNTDRFGEKTAITTLRILNSIGLFKSYKPLSVAQVASAILQAINRYTTGIHTVTVKDIQKLAAETS